MERNLEFWEVDQNYAFNDCERSPRSGKKETNGDDRRPTDRIMAEYGLAMEEIDIERENQVRGKMEWLKHKLVLKEEEIGDALKRLNTDNLIELEKQDFIETWNNCKEIASKISVYVDNFFTDVSTCEREYIKKAEKLIKYYYEQMRRVTPNFHKDLFEKDILKININVANNLRSYSDLYINVIVHRFSKLRELKNNLALELETWVQKKNNQLAEEEKLRAAMRSETRKTSQPKECTVSWKETQEAKIILFLHFLCRNEPGYEMKYKWILNSIRTDVADWVDRLKKNENVIDEDLKTLISTYKTAKSEAILSLQLLVESFDLFFQHVMLEDTAHRMLSTEIENTILRDSMLSVLFKDADLIEHSETTSTYGLLDWYKDTRRLRGKLKEAILFFAEVSRIWENHMDRFDLAKTIIASAFEAEETRLSQKLNKNEMTILMAVSNLRLESVEDKMAEFLKSITKISTDTQDQCFQELMEEINIVGRFLNFCKQEGNLLCAEISNLLNNFSFEKRINYFDEMVSPSQTEEQEKRKDVQMCDLKVNALENWMTALQRYLLTYSKISHIEVPNRANEWMTRESYGVSEKYDNLIRMQSMQYDRVVEQVYKVRLMEIRNHNLLLESHKIGVENSFSTMPSELDNFVFIYTENLSESSSYFSMNMEIAKESSSSDEVSALLDKVNERQSKDISLFQNASTNFREQCDRKFEYVRKCQLNFRNSLKMFSEGGTYTAEEAWRFHSMLNDIEKVIDKNKQTFFPQLTKQIATLEQSIKQNPYEAIKYLSQMLDELRLNEETAAIMSETDELIKKELDEARSESMRCQRDFKNTILLLYNELSSLPPDSLLKALDIFLKCLNSRALHLLIVPPGDGSRSSLSENLSVTSMLKAAVRSRQTLPKMVVGKSKLTDYTKLLPNFSEFSEIPQTFLLDVGSKLKMRLSSLQEKALAFYGTRTGKSVIRKDLIQETYEEFMSERSNVFKTHYLACLEAWHQDVETFLELVYKLQHATNLFVARRLVEFHSSKLQKLERVYDHFRSEKAANISEDQLQRKRMKRKLLAIHGYNSNKKLWNDLHEQMTCLCSQLEKNMVEFINKGMQYLRNIEEKYKIRSRTFCEKLIEFREKVFEASTCDILLRQLRMTSSTLLPTAMKKESATINSLQTSTLTIVDFSLQCQLIDGINDGELPKLKDFIKECRRSALVELEALVRISQSDITQEFTCFSPNHSFTLENLNSIDVLDAMIADYSKVCEKYLEIMNFSEEYTKISAEWMSDWECELKAVTLPLCS